MSPQSERKGRGGSTRRLSGTSRWNTDLVRVWVSSVLSFLVTVVVLMLLIRMADVDLTDPLRLQVTTFVILWPAYTIIYVGWGSWVYSRLDQGALAAVASVDEKNEHGWFGRIFLVTGTTNTTISAAVVAVIITVIIAQRPEFRGEAVYIAGALLTVACSWVLMVFSFAQNYLRLGAADDGEHVRFHFPERAQFTDYVTLAVLLSTMAATTPAQLSSRRAWKVARTNVVIAFIFNSVVIAMLVSLLFGGLSG